MNYESKLSLKFVEVQKCCFLLWYELLWYKLLWYELLWHELIWYERVHVSDKDDK